ncbi:MAG: NAD-dependent epimerase/dehydratase family protein, partial [Anaerolinea sp.]|nr:NAD-dependent epimerase/dehydratase family protein [Anaerolinea sp.]
DITDAPLVDRLLADHGVRRIAHLAGLAGVRYSVDHGPLYSHVNTTGSVTLMEAARRHGIAIFVQASTSSVYGQAQRVPFQEDDAPDLPLAPYPASKRAAEIFGHSYHNLFGLNVTVLRFFNVYGPNGRPDMMPLRALRAILHDEPIPYYDGGRLRRDWTYIDDTVSGIAAALERPLGYAIINLGCGAPVALADFIAIYEDLLGKRAVLVDQPAPPSEPLITYCDNRRARDLLGFAPVIDLRTGLTRVLEWYRAQGRSTGTPPR